MSRHLLRRDVTWQDGWDLEGDSLGLTGDEFLFVGLNSHAGPLSSTRFASASSGYEDAGFSTFQSEFAASASPVVNAGSAALIEHSGKIGIGTWDIDAKGTALKDLGRFEFGWYYNWQAKPLWTPQGGAASEKGFVPMIWGAKDATAANLRAAENTSSKYLLGFNEPDNSEQANMSVTQALRLWPELMATNKLLGSPATMTSGTLGADSWLGRFMNRAEAKAYDVDFVAVHYYSEDPSISAFREFLRDVRQEYGKAVWVTEWALVDWEDPARFSERQLAAFAEKATAMMDDLSFVKRQAWFGTYAGGSGWNIDSELIEDHGRLTKVGEAFADLTI